MCHFLYIFGNSLFTYIHKHLITLRSIWNRRERLGQALESRNINSMMQLVKYLSYYVPDVEKPWDEYNFIRRGDFSAPTPSSNWEIGDVKCCGARHSTVGSELLLGCGCMSTDSRGRTPFSWMVLRAIPATDESSCEVGALVSALDTPLPCSIEKSTGGWGVGGSVLPFGLGT